MRVDVASEVCEYVMRIAALLSFAVLTAATVPSFAATDARKVACRDQASAIADEWAAGDIYRAKADEEPESNEVLVIAGGVKYFVPRKGSGVIRPVGQRIYQRKQVYLEEYRRCLRDGEFSALGDVVEPAKKVH
jgi:hypothetical protein